jgi:hypothetical protein
MAGGEVMPRDQNQVSDLPCELCGATMTFVESTPKVGPFPELLTFLCTECGDVRTVEKKDE